MRHNRSLRQLLAFFHVIAFEHDDVLCERDQMLFFGASIGILQDQTPFAAHGSSELDDTVDLGDLSRVLWPARFEQFCNTRQTSRDIFCLGNFPRCLCQQGAGTYFLALLDDDVSASWN